MSTKHETKVWAGLGDAIEAERFRDAQERFARLGAAALEALGEREGMPNATAARDARLLATLRANAIALGLLS